MIQIRIWRKIEVKKKREKETKKKMGQTSAGDVDDAKEGVIIRVIAQKMTVCKKITVLSTESVCVSE